MATSPDVSQDVEEVEDEYEDQVQQERVDFGDEDAEDIIDENVDGEGDVEEDDMQAAQEALDLDMNEEDGIRYRDEPDGQDEVGGIGYQEPQVSQSEGEGQQQERALETTEAEICDRDDPAQLENENRAVAHKIEEALPKERSNLVEGKNQESKDDLLLRPEHGSEVFIGNISKDTSEEDLIELCASCGDIFEVRVMRDKDSSNKGFAFVTFANKEIAQKAIQMLHDSELKGRKLRCSPSQLKNKLFIGNVPKSLREKELEKLLVEMGPGLQHVELLKDPHNPDQNRGFAFVEYYNNACADNAKKALSLPGFKLGINIPTINWAESPSGVDNLASCQMEGSSTSISRPALLYTARLLFREMGTPPKDVAEELRFLDSLSLEDLKECIFMQMKLHANKCCKAPSTYTSTELVTIEGPHPDLSTTITIPNSTPDTTSSRTISEIGGGKDGAGPSYLSTRPPKLRFARRLEVPSPSRPITSSHGLLLSSSLTCVGSLGITCEIDENLDIVRSGGGIIFRRRLQDLVESYLPRVEMSWRDQNKEHKKYVIDGLQREFGTGWQTKSILKEISGLLRHRRDWARRIARSGEKVTRPSSMAKKTWTHFRHESRSGAQAPQQKAAAASRLRKGHTSRLGSGGLKRFRAQFLKDYGHAPSEEEQRIATYHGYKYLIEQYPPQYREEEDKEEVAQDVDM